MLLVVWHFALVIVSQITLSHCRQQQNRRPPTEQRCFYAQGYLSTLSRTLYPAGSFGIIWPGRTRNTCPKGCRCSLVLPLNLDFCGCFMDSLDVLSFCICLKFKNITWPINFCLFWTCTFPNLPAIFAGVCPRMRLAAICPAISSSWGKDGRSWADHEE